jgi:hypothetical protein
MENGTDGIALLGAASNFEQRMQKVENDIKVREENIYKLKYNIIKRENKIIKKENKIMKREMMKNNSNRVVRRHLNSYNIFTKQRSLERTENMKFGKIIEFLDFALDKNVFEKKRVHKKKDLHAVHGGSDGDGCELTLKAFTAETSNMYKVLPDKHKKIYKEIAAYINNLPCLSGKTVYRNLKVKIEELEADPQVKNGK